MSKNDFVQRWRQVAGWTVRSICRRAIHWMCQVLCKSDQLFFSTAFIYSIDSMSIYHAKLSVAVFMSLKLAFSAFNWSAHDA